MFNTCIHNPLQKYPKKKKKHKLSITLNKHDIFKFDELAIKIQLKFNKKNYWKGFTKS